VPWSVEVSSDSEFRTPEQEVLRLLEECSELRRLLKSISAQVGRMENRLKQAFPGVASQAHERRIGGTHSSTPSITPEQALAEFDRVVALAAVGANDQAERILEGKSAVDLLVIAKELGIALPKSKPSIRAMREAIFGKVRESVLLTRHHARTQATPPEQRATVLTNAMDELTRKLGLLQTPSVGATKTWAKRARELRDQGKSWDQSGLIAASETFSAEFSPTKYDNQNGSKIEALVDAIERQN
jgi:hypothetical protein